MRKSTNVYFNKRKNDMGGKYKTGTFFSKKNNSGFVYRSAYEYAYLVKLEKDDNVVNFIVEPFKIPYLDERGHKHVYIPDIVVLKANGNIDLIEIKPKSMLQNARVQRKASAARAFLKRNHKDAVIEYKFITEEDIVENYKEYIDLLKTI